MKKYFIFIALVILLFSISSACAEEMGDNSTVLEVDDALIDGDSNMLEYENTPVEEDNFNNDEEYEILGESADSSCSSSNDKNELEDSSDVIVVNNWNELQYYAAKNDKNYVVKLKENTNFYPDSLSSISYQIKINNNLTIIGSNGSYIGDGAPNPIDEMHPYNGRSIIYAPIVVPDDNGCGVTVENVTFKWIYNVYKHDAVFFTMGGNSINTFRNCVFENIETYNGHSCIVYIKKGDATLENCTFINCTTDFGCVSIYNPNDDPTGICTSARMVIKDCYFENNYARTEPGCVNNCGVAIIYNSTFVNNRAAWWAGAIHTHGGANTTLYNCEFIHNIAGWNGGALYTYSWLQIFNSTFRDNTCYTNSGGGAIGACKYLNTPKIYIADSLFENNANLCPTGGAGGAIAVMDEGNLQVYNSTFIKNSAAAGTAIKASAEEGYGSPTIIIEGNKFINHTLANEVISIYTKGTEAIIKDNYFLNNGISFSKISLNISEPFDKRVNVTIDSKLRGPGSYDNDILDKCSYDIYIDGKYKETINSTKFTLNFEDIDKCTVYIKPSISIYRSEDFEIVVPREFIYVSKSIGNDNNDGLSNETPVKTIQKAIELAKSKENILLMDGEFMEENLVVDYRLTIWGTENSSITGTTTNSMFNVNNAKFSLRNLTINHLKINSDSSRLIMGIGSRIFLDNCIIKNNVANKFIESSVLGITNSLFENNKFSIKISNLSIFNSTFISNTVNNNEAFFTSIESDNWNLIDSAFKNNYDLKEGLFDYSSGKTFKIENSIFENNTALVHASCIKISDEAKLIIFSSIIKNNNANLPIIYKNGVNSSIDIKNSVIINEGDIISGDISKIDLNYNWWGNTIENKDSTPILNPQLSLDNWLFLDIDYPQEVEHGIKYILNITLNNLMTKDNTISKYKNYKLPKLTFSLNVNNISVGNNYSEIITGESKIIISLTGVNDGAITANYDKINISANIHFIKTNPKRLITAKEIMVGDEGNVEVILPDDAKGHIYIQICNITESKMIEHPMTNFKLNGLKAGTFNLLINYSGDEKYNSFEDIINFTVKRYNSITKITVGKVKVSEDVNITVEVPSDASGNVTLMINNIETNLKVVDSKVCYTIHNITRGDWKITAIYNGNSKYNPSTDYAKIEVEKLIPSVIINIPDIKYGEDANIQVILNKNATGNVTISIDNFNRTVALVNGRALISIPNLTAGNKVVNVTYSGDRFYASQNYFPSFYIEKIATSFNVIATNSKEGQDVIVDLSIPYGVAGNFTINVGNLTEILPIPLTGEVEWKVSTLPVGEYTITITYTGQNYLTCKNHVNIIVYPWEETQWPNDGYDSKNSGKSPYESNITGNIEWMIETNEQILGNIAIDNEGNIYIITLSGICSYDKNGKYRWDYSFTFGNSFSGISIGREVIIAPVSGDTLYFINQTSGQKIGDVYQGSSIFSPVIDEKFNIYISSEEDYETGNYNLIMIPYSSWGYGGGITSINLGNSSITTAPVVVNDNIICIGTEGGLKIVDISQKTVISTLNIISNLRPVVGDGDIIYTISSDELIAIDSTGNIIWRNAITGVESKYLAIDNENNALYSITAIGDLYKYDVLNLGSESLVTDLNVTSGILIGNDGTLYVGVENTLLAFDHDGKLIMKSNTGNNFIGTPIMDKFGNIYVYGNNTLFKINRTDLKNPNLTVNNLNIEYKTSSKLIITLEEEVTGDISIIINETEYIKHINNGNVEIDISNLSIGNYNLKISYNGDRRYYSVENHYSLNISKIKIPINYFDIFSEISTSTSLSFNLPENTSGTITVNVDGKNYGNELISGSTTINVPKLSSGKHNIVVTYSGDDNYAPITAKKTVNVPYPKITDNKNIAMDYNDGSTYKVRVIGSDGNIVVGGVVTFKINGKTSKIKTNKNGYASVKITETPKKYTITATYKEITVKNTVTVKQILKSSNFKVKKSAKKLVLKATLKSSKGKAIKGKQIKFKFNGKTYKAKTNKKGIAKVTIKKNVIKKLKVKKYALQITYLKDTLKKTVNVKK